MPHGGRARPVSPTCDTVPEELIFDKAEEAEELERIVYELDSLATEKKALEDSLDSLEGDDLKAAQRCLQKREADRTRLLIQQEAMADGRGPTHRK